MANFIGEPVTRRRRELTGTDIYGTPVFELVDTVLPERAAFDPGGDTVISDPTRVQVVTKPKLYFLRAVPDLRRDDSVIARGVVYEIDGEPSDWVDPFGSMAGGLVVELKRAEG